MNFRSLVLFALALTLLPGCLSLSRPSKQDRQEASARAGKWLAAHRSEVGKSTFLVYASDRPTSFEFSSHEGKCDYKFARPEMDSGLATGISDDGYLLTAVHVVKEHCFVVGWMDGKPAVSPARVVYKKFGGEFGEELAILHVDKRLDCPIALGALDSAESDVYAFACDRQAELKVVIIAGKIIQRPEPKPNEDAAMMAMDAPLWKGDSGGAVMSKDGKLVGVFVGVSRSFTTFRVSRMACVPDMDRVLAIIEADRLKAKEPNPVSEPRQP
jgi:S1-C subfamily serine protease